MTAGTNKDLDISVDSGKWYTLKAQNKLTPAQVDAVPLLPYSGWKKFPSCPNDIPKLFNQGHIHHHIVESVQFVNAEEISNESDEDIEDLHTAKPLIRGEKYLKSGHVLKIHDCCKSGHYFMKAKVMASYSVSTEYDVTVTLSQVSGFVRDASCTCKASAMGRCSHVTALLLALKNYLDTCSSDISCTSVPCTWNRGRQKRKTPKRVQQLSYSTKKRKCQDVINFDPRAPSTVKNDLQLQDDLLWNIETSSMYSCMWSSLLEYKYSDYDLDNEHLQVLKEWREIFLQNLKVPNKSNDPVLLVSDQKSDHWFTERRVRLTASTCHSVVSFQSDVAVSNFLNRKLWRTESISTVSLKYGLENEKTARQSYHSLKSGKVNVFETGLWVSNLNPELGCSPDGLIFDLDEPERYGILEIKCPKILENKPVSEFLNSLTSKQLKHFCLQNVDGKISIKEKHPYYSQVQMQMGVTGLKFCDFVVWSSKETFVTRIKFDEKFWSAMKEKLIEFHHSYLCPELFEMRIPRELRALKIE
ncbi:MAG: YqaJ viral recombinase family protein [Candidatus Thiodiazotropha taylori]|nr:YqaJ viral recombinase family protein [Candidatus Thiodiazotropha taylori]